MEDKSTESPFLEAKPYRFSFSIMLLLMLMVVAVGAAMLIALALRVPAFSTELRAYMGLPELDVEPGVARKSHLIFLLYLYSAPLGLGILVYLLHSVLKRFAKVRQPEPEDREFEMGLAAQTSSKR